LTPGPSGLSHVVVSAASAASGWVEREIEMAERVTVTVDGYRAAKP
jgi:hypothetical protein